MNRYTLSIFVLVLVAIGAGSVWYLMHSKQDAEHAAAPHASSTVENRTGEAIYTNGEFGFSLMYPQTASVEDIFAPTYHLASSWRANALATGTPIVSLVAYATVSDHSYPRYFNALVRVGASSEKAELASCTKPSKGETALPDVTIQGVTWKAFSFESAGMMQYVRGVSYRTLHEGACVALEKIQTGSSYKEDAPSADDVASAELTKQYETLDTIIQSFSFARP